MQISGVSLALTWPRRLCLLRVLLGTTATVTSFPLSKLTHLLWLACLFTAHVEVGLPSSPVEFSSHRHFYKVSRSWLLGMCRGSCLLPPACCKGFPSPPLVLRAPHPLCYVSFCCCLLFSFFLFFLCGGQSFQGLIWPRVVYGSTVYRLAHPVVCFSRAGRSWRLVVQEPSWFLHLTWTGDAMPRLVVWQCWSFASSWWFFL
jgi:hypothetical protein